MKLYSIKIRNDRYTKTLAGGLPAFNEWETFDSVKAAAKAIVDGAYDILEADAADACVDVPDEKVGDAISAELERVEAEIEMRCGWSYDGVSYSIVCDDYGRICTGTIDDDHLINAEPLFPAGPGELCTHEQAEDALYEFCENECLEDWDVVQSPWGWTVTWTEEDEDLVKHKRTMECCWVSAQEAE